jgi:hypothetical protein
MKLGKLVIFAVVLFLGVICVSRASAQSGIMNQNGRNFTCASDDGGRHYCRVDTRNGVRLVNQRSGSPCRQGSTWGYDRSGVWVDRGCRADFVLGQPYGPGPGYPGNGYNPGIGNGAGWNGGPPPGGGVITCSSNNGGRNFCPAYVSRGVRLVNQRSGSPCVLGQTWGFNDRGIWVDRGCRADFAINR